MERPKLAGGEETKTRRGTFTKTLLQRKATMNHLIPETLKAQFAKKSSPSGPRTFQAQEVTYDGPNILPFVTTEEPQPEDTLDNQQPVFVGPDGILYDRNYNTIAPETDQVESVDNNGGGGGGDERIHGNKIKHNTLAPFPDEEKYENFFDYEQAVLDWKVQLEKQLANLELPQVIGRNYFRPRVSPATRKRSDSLDDDDNLSAISSSLSDSDPMIVRGDSVMDIASMASVDGFDSSGAGSPVQVRSRASSIIGTSTEQSPGSSPRTRPRSTSVSWKDEVDRAGQSSTPPRPGSPSQVPSPGGTLSLMPPRPLLKRSSEPDLQSRTRETRKSTIYSSSGSPSVGELSMSSDASDVDDKWSLDHDPWDTCLIPPVPSVYLYSSFSKYEAAIRRWAYLVSSSARFIPPHPSQLQEIINLTPARDINEEIARQDLGKVASSMAIGSSDSSVLDDWELKIRTGLVAPTVIESIPSLPKSRSLNPSKTASSSSDLDSASSLTSTLSRWLLLAPKVKRNLLELVDTLQRHADDMQHHYSIVAKPPPKPPLISNPLPPCPTPFPALPIRALRKVPNAADSSIDPELPLDFSSLSHKVSGKNFETRSKYLRHVQYQASRVQYQGRWDFLNSWAHPDDLNNQSMMDTSRIVSIFESLIDGLDSNASLSVPYEEVIAPPLFLDRFQQALFSPSKEGPPIIQLIAGSLAPDNFVAILAMMEMHSDVTVRGRVAAMVWGIMSNGGDRSTLLIEHILRSNKIHALENLATAISFFDEIPMDLFPFDSNGMVPLAERVIRFSSKEIFDQVFTLYYLNILLTRLQPNPSAKIIVAFLSSTITSIVESISMLLQDDPSFICPGIWLGIGHRSASVSTVSLFIILQLIHLSVSKSSPSPSSTTTKPSNDIFKTLTDPDNDFVSNLRELACSRFSHSRYGAGRIFKILQEDSNWENYIFGEYHKGKMLIEDLTKLSHKSDKPSFLSNLVLDMSLRVLESSTPRPLDTDTPPVVVHPAQSRFSVSTNPNDYLGSSAFPPLPISTQPVFIPPIRKDKEKLAKDRPIATGYKADKAERTPLGFLLSDTVFQGILKVMKSSLLRMDVLAVLFERLCRALYRFNMIEAIENIKSSKKEKGNATLKACVSIYPPDVQQLLSYINSINSYDKYKVKAAMLKGLTHLLKHKGTFEFVKKEIGFYLKLMSFCRDYRTAAFNRTAWGAVYQILRYHPGAMETLERVKILPQILDILGPTGSTTVLINSLRYVVKIFRLPEHEQQLILSGRSSPRSDSKSIEKDVKTLANLFITKHKFISLHMIYKRLAGKEMGQVYIHLAELYAIIGTNPLCLKLFKDTQRNPEYKDGLAAMCAMFANPLSM